MVSPTQSSGNNDRGETMVHYAITGLALAATFIALCELAQ